MKAELFARQCDHCKSLMNEGYVINGGENYYCTDKCRNEGLGITDKEWEEEWYDDDGDSYWTDWECPTEFNFIKVLDRVYEIEVGYEFNDMKKIHGEELAKHITQ